MDHLVNDEFAIGFDARFERRFVYLQWAGQAVLVGVVVLALLGFLGRGPYSHATAQIAGGALSVDYEPVARYGTTTQITLHVHDPGATIQVGIDTRMIEPMGLQSITPRPIREIADGSGVRFTVLAQPGRPAFIRLHVKPTIVGPVSLEATVDGEPMLRWNQVVLP